MGYKQRAKWWPFLATLFVLVLLIPSKVAWAIPYRDSVQSLDDVNLAKQYEAEQARKAAEEKARQEAAQREAEQQKNNPIQNTFQLESKQHIVKSGETLSAIATRYRVTISQLMAWNGLKSANLIRVGQSLLVGDAPVAAQASTHTVRTGESLWSIAVRYKTSVSALATANGISSRGVIYPGQHLAIPGSATVASRGSTSYQFIWPVVGTITSGYGPRWGKFHYAIDIAANKGTAIKAASAGVVEYSGWKTSYGYCVVIDHGRGVKTVYGHACKLYVRKGDRVVAGQTIAAVGSTGFSTGPHVHFEVVVNGRNVNPLAYLIKSGR